MLRFTSLSPPAEIPICSGSEGARDKRQKTNLEYIEKGGRKGTRENGTHTERKEIYLTGEDMQNEEQVEPACANILPMYMRKRLDSYWLRIHVIHSRCDNSEIKNNLRCIS